MAQLNQAIVQVEPWTLAKDPARRAELDAFLYRLVEGVRLVAVLVSPVMPAGGRAHLRDARPRRARARPGRPRLGPPRARGAARHGAPLFPRVDKTNDKETPVSDTNRPPLRSRSAAPAPPVPAAPAPAPPLSRPPARPAGDRIDISEFAKVELRAAKVTAAEKVGGSKKLVKLQVDLGTETRQVVAGIAESYEPEALVGKTVVLVANLKPAKLMGVESNGMVLAGSVDGKAVLCTFDAEVAPGTKVK